MATQTLGTAQILTFPRATDVSEQVSRQQSGALAEERRSIFRGFFYAMIFNLFLLLTGAAGWVFWRIIR